MSKESHSFSVEVACKIGVVRAIILQHLIFLQRSAPNGWVKKSARAMAETYPYLTEKQIRGAVDAMESDGLLMSSINNERMEDRTKSYFVTKDGHRVYGTDPFALLSDGVPKRGNGMYPKSQMDNGSYSFFTSSSCAEQIKKNPLVRDNFSLVYKLPAAKFDDYLAAWISDTTAKEEKYNNLKEALTHFYNFSSKRHQIETRKPQQFNKGSEESKPVYIRPKNLITA